MNFVNNKRSKQPKILLTGGGTFGSVTPLIAIKEELDKDNRDHELLWVGTRQGPEKKFIEKQGIKFKAIFSGKLRRYFDFRNFIDPLFILIGFFQSLIIIFKFKPNVILSAGGFVSVPVALAGFVLRVPILIHQMDIRPGLANKIMAPLATKITVGFEKSLQDYPRKKTILTGNPVRQSLKIRNPKSEILNNLKLNNNLPVVLIMGGGTGAMAINKLVKESLEELTKFCQIIHMTGKNKITNHQSPITNYHPFEFLNNMPEIYAVTDAVVSRCGIGSLSELAFLGKPSISIPMPDSHQEENAQIFKDAKAIVVLNQEKLTPDIFVANIKEVSYNKTLRQELSKNIKKLARKEASKEVVKIIYKIIDYKL